MRGTGPSRSCPLALPRASPERSLNIPILYPQVGLAYTDQVDGLTWYRSGHIEFAGVCVES